MSEFKNWGIGQIVVFTKYYQLNGAGKKGSTTGFNINARITDHGEHITENGIQYGYIVEDILTLRSYFVLDSDCTLAED